MAQKGMIKQGEACIIWTSPEITNGPLTTRVELNKDLKEAVRALVKDLPTKNPELYKQIDGGEQLSTGAGYIDVDHSRYDWIVELREVIRELRKKRAS
jgi:phosphonate transport system substrate-binding protein